MQVVVYNGCKMVVVEYWHTGIMEPAWRSNSPSIRSPGVDKETERMRLVFHTLMVVWNKGHPVNKNMCHLSTKNLFCNKWRKKSDGKPLTQVHWEMAVETELGGPDFYFLELSFFLLNGIIQGSFHK